MDTLDEHLNIFSVQQGMSSHPFSFRMYGERILEWRMINYRFLPESIDPIRSKGYVSFKVQQNTPYWVTDISGKVIVSGMVKQQKTTVDLSELNSGVYVLKVGGYLVKGWL